MPRGFLFCVSGTLIHRSRLTQLLPHVDKADALKDFDVTDMPAVPDIMPSKKAYNALLKGGEVSAARALVSAVLNSTWTATRKAEAFGGSDLCHRCQGVPETPSHRYWHCSCNNALGNHVERTNSMRRRATRGDPSGQQHGPEQQLVFRYVLFWFDIGFLWWFILWVNV